MERTVSVILNGKTVKGYPGQKILDLCAENGIEIPTLCYDKHLSLYGGCSICLVEVKGARSLVRACATPIQEGMEIETHTERVKGARKLALELLLSDHVGDCRPPCQLACPARADVKSYVNLAAEGKFRSALDVLHQGITLPASIGRVCPAPCQEKCRRHFVDEEPVSIREIKRYIGDWGLSQGDLGEIPQIKENGKSVAIVGGGPAGLSAAYYLRLKGYKVTIFEKESKLGGMMRYGIPDYRLPQEILEKECQWLLAHGIETRMNTALGKDVTLEELKKQYDAVLLAMGCWKSTPMRVPGEDLPGVIGGIEFLYKVNNKQETGIGKKVAIIGGGNTAMDAARCSLREGAEKVYVVYRRTREEMPAEDIEIEEAMEEGVEFIFLAAPTAIEGNSRVESIVCEKMALGAPDASGRRRPIPTGETFTLEVDTVIAAIGQRIDLSSLPQDIHDGKWLKVDEHFATPYEGVFVCGDQKTGPGIAVEAIGSGHWAAESIHHYLTEGIPHRPFECDVVRDDLGPEDFLDVEKQPMEKPLILEPQERLSKPYEEFNKGLTEEQVTIDGSRCMKCGCPDIHECKLREYSIEYEASPDAFPKELYSRPDRPEEANTYYIRNMDKCIQCGVCVRTCEEIANCHAIDFQKRGIKTFVGPGVDRTIEHSDCIFCGLCVQNCPTGALVERTAFGISRPSKTKLSKTICTYCSVGCELVAHTDLLTGRIDNVTADLDNQMSINKGKICAKGRFDWQFVNRDDRIKTPLIKVNGTFQEASWVEALEFVSKKLMAIKDQYGSDSIGFCASNHCTNEENYLLQRFAREVVGTNNVDTVDSTYYMPVINGLTSTLGMAAMTNDFDSLKNANVILLLEANLAETHPVAEMWIKELKKASSAKLLISNSTPTKLDRYADITLQQNKGTSVALLNGLMHIIVEEGLYNSDYVMNNTENFGELKKLLSEYSPSKVAAITGIPEKALREAARTFASGPNSAIIFGDCLLQLENAEENVKSIANLALLCGMLGRQGTGIYPVVGASNTVGAFDMGCTPRLLPGYLPSNDETARSKVEAIWNCSLPTREGHGILDMIDKASKGELKAMYIMGSDIAKKLSCKDALSNLDLLVVQDIFLNETAQLADVVLPAACWGEKDGTKTNACRVVQKTSKAAEAPQDARPDWWILTQLAEACGRSWSFENPESIMNEISNVADIYGGITYDRLNTKGLAWPCWNLKHEGTPILFTEGFHNRKARFAPCEWKSAN